MFVYHVFSCIFFIHIQYRVLFVKRLYICIQDNPFWNSLVSGESSKPTPNVAFFAGLKDNQGSLEQNVDLVFDKAVTNVGGAFDEETGRFMAPYDGVYHFTVVVAAQGKQKVLALSLHLF